MATQLMGCRKKLFGTLKINNELKKKIEHYEELLEEMQCHIEVLTVADDADFIREEPDYKNINRIEFIDDTGRAYVKRFIGKVEFSRQDSGETLKIFINKR